MYLSQLILNPRSRRVQREVAEPYQMHRSLMQAFPDDLEEGEERVLWRVEAHSQTGALTLLVQSWNVPDWSWLAEPGAHGYLLPVSQPNPGVKSFEPALSAGQVLAFQLRANPTVKRKFDSGDHKRVGLYGEEEQMEWLRRKAEQGGFRVLSARASHQEVVNGTVRRNGKAHRLHLLAVQFDGWLEVTEPDQTHRSLRQGIGSAKGFGFGLLSLARPRG